MKTTTMKKTILFLSSALTITLLSPVASAGSITCGSTQRTATLDSAEECKTGSGNTLGNGTTIDGHYGGTWTAEGSLEAQGSNGYLTAGLTTGSWGDQNVTGTWAIDSSFWSIYAEAVISIHVGNGGGSNGNNGNGNGNNGNGNGNDNIVIDSGPDHFTWLITENATSGSWSYDKLAGTGGGLSNMKLWGSGVAANVPEPALMVLFLIGLLSLVAVRKNKKV